jgi:hypothetical protein
MEFNTKNIVNLFKRVSLSAVLLGAITTNVSFAEDVPDEVQAVFANNCLNGCHVTGNENGGLNLEDKTVSFLELYEVNASCNANSKRVRERDANASVLYSKVNGGTPICGGVMPPGGSISAGDQVIIRDWINNLHPNGSITFVPASVQPIVGETQGTITLNVSRGPATTGDVSVDFVTANGTAEAGTDFVAQSGTLAFTDGQTTGQIIIDILDDADIEGDENFRVVLSNPLGGALLGIAPVSTVTIADDDDPPSPGILLMNGNSFTVNENDGTADIIIRRASGNEGAISVTLNTSNGSAIAGTDYESISQTVSFANAVNTQMVTLTLIDNAIFEGNKSFTASISNPQGGATLGSPNTMTISIVDDEPDPNAGGGNGGGGGGTPPPAPPPEEFRDAPESIGAIWWMILLLPVYRLLRRR